MNLIGVFYIEATAYWKIFFKSRLNYITPNNKNVKIDQDKDNMVSSRKEGVRLVSA